MTTEGPRLQPLLQRVRNSPAELQRRSAPSARDPNRIVAIVADTLRDFGVPHERIAEIPGWWAGDPPTGRRSTYTLLAAWLLRDPIWREGANRPTATALEQTFRHGLGGFEQLVRPDQAVRDPDRTEEFVRRILAVFDFRPHGESESYARDRLTTLDSVEHHRILRESKAATDRARKIREAMAARAARETAPTYARE